MERWETNHRRANEINEQIQNPVLGTNHITMITSTKGKQGKQGKQKQ